ncbi:hypothetical protein OH77DRAFT_1583336 [Trametes cingulata]|nr:hypothetical protein OH77DRAFT_1583336 [Trametes cingulata]
MSRILDEDNRREFPFPRMDSFRSSSPSSGSLPSRSDSSHSKSLRSSGSSGSPVPRARVEQDHDSLHSSVPSKLLSRLMPREHHDTRSLRTILAVTTERLQSETRRADDAERRVLEVLRKLRTAHEATMVAQSDAARAREELALYKYRLEDAQREISRAQEIINELEQEKLEAEAEAARARSTARRYREQQLMARAREEGRQEGFQEGFTRGKDMGFQEAMVTESVAEPADDRRYQKRPVLVEEVEDEEGEIAPSRYRVGTPAPDYRSRTPASDIRVRTPGPEYRTRTPGPSGASWRPPSRMTQSRASQRSQHHIPDAAHHAATLPVPTVTTPLNVPSPSHSQADIPAALSRPSSRPVRPGDVPPPIPIHEPTPSPAHPSVEIPPDGWIPYEDPDGGISLPPPHELSRPVTPRSISPAPPPEASAPPQASTAQEPQIPVRDYLYANPSASQSGPMSRSNINRPFSPQSKASTSISQFDLVAPRSKSRGARAREDRVPMSPRGPRPREDLPPLRPEMGERNDTATTSKSSEPNGSPTTPLDRAFKKRFRRGLSNESAIPAIVVQSPSTTPTSPSSTRTQITHPHLLSPEHNPRPLIPQDDIVVMPVNIPGYNPTGPSVPGPYKPPYMDDDDESPVIPPPPDILPPGFVPLTPPMRPGSTSDAAIPIPSNSPLPVPPSNPLPIPSNDPLPIPQRGPLPIPQSNSHPVPPRNPLPVPDKDPVRIPHNDPVPVPHSDPIPIPHNAPLPVPHRSRTPGRQRYDEASLPAGMVYPSPPSRRARTPGPSVSSPTGSRRGLRDLRSPGERLSPLPLDFFAPLRSDTNTE